MEALLAAAAGMGAGGPGSASNHDATLLQVIAWIRQQRTHVRRSIGNAINSLWKQCCQCWAIINFLHSFWVHQRQMVSRYGL